MKSSKTLKIMCLMVGLGCLATYQFIEFHNNKIDQNFSPKKFSYEEVDVTTYNKINDLIAEQKAQSADKNHFINSLEKAMMDLRVTKEVYSHSSNAPVNTTPVYPILVLWAAISAFLFMLVRAKEQKIKSLKNYYEKILDQLEMSYSQDLSKDKNEIEVKESSFDSRPTANKEI